MQNNSRQILISPLFLIGLFILLLDDFVLKAQFHNFLTGKLSDFAGLFIFPLFFSGFFPRRKVLIFTLTGFLFIFWKSPFSQSLIDLWNSLQFLRIGRTIDYTDLLALLVLPLSYFYFKTKTQKQKMFPLHFAKRVLASFVVLLSVFAFTATSYEEDRSVWLKQKYELKMTKLEFEEKLKSIESLSSLEIKKQTDAFPANKYPDVKTNPNSYYVRFHLQRKYCESNKLKIFFRIEEEKESIVFDDPNFSFWCKQKPTEQDNQQLLTIFESEVIEKLRQNNPQ